ncbi:hypothetical protein RR42_s3378 [Cupriavidus basilensis]|uniref:Uncharacterized protein n=1 Tax=Cupriavidus basilensis TaxID=68895 RepID=A0A0C4YSP0_9BURK|nr:hypothetical protein RR42_s3378 [Cupriavidus basilensis]
MASRWRETDVRNVRHELTAERKAKIAEAAKRETSSSGEAAIVAAAALTRAQRRAVPLIGHPRSDSQRIRDALAALKSMEDRELAASLVQGIEAVLADFDYEFPES